MTREEVLEILTNKPDGFPRDALVAAVELREEIVPDLLRILEDTLGRAEEIIAEDPEGWYTAHMYALYLLAQFREPRAYPLVVKLMRLDDQSVEDLFGDFVTEDLRRVLASVCGGDTGLIESIVEDPSVYEYSRDAALLAFSVLLREGVKSREEVVAYFRLLFKGKLEREPSAVWNCLVAEAIRLHPGELAGYITGAFDDGLVDTFFISRNALDKALKRDKEELMANFMRRNDGGFVEDIITEFPQWGIFDTLSAKKKPPVLEPDREFRTFDPAKSGPRIGRNDLCPCGSGKKYKKCCLRAG